MLAIHPEYVIDERLNKKAVIIPFIEWEKILDILEEFDDIRAYDSAKKIQEELLPFDEALNEIESGKFDEV